MPANELQQNIFTHDTPHLNNDQRAVLENDVAHQRVVNAKVKFEIRILERDELLAVDLVLAEVCHNDGVDIELLQPGQHQIDAPSKKISQRRHVLQSQPEKS